VGAAALLLACTGATGEGGTGLEVLYEGEDGPFEIALDDRYIYWVSAVGLRRAPIDGGEPVTLAPLTDVRGMVPAGDDLYFYRGSVSSGSEIGRVPREGGEPTWVANVVNPQGLIASAEGVFWSDSGGDWDEGRLLRAGLDGSGATELATGLVSPRFIALDGEQLYFGNGNVANCPSDSSPPCVELGLFRLSIAAGAPERVLSTVAATNPVWNEGAMYWLAGYPRPSDVMMLPPGGAAQPVVDMLMDSSLDSARLTSDAEAIYWTTGTRVLRMSFATREVERLVTGLDATTSLALRGDWVYVTESTTGRILRIATDGSAYRPTADPITGPCPTPVGSADELALTPRAEPNLELLAFTLEPDNVVVSQATYDRVVSDVAASRALEPTLADVSYFQPHDGRRIQLEWTEAAALAFADGQYTAWDCLNEAYGLVGFNAYNSSVDLELEGTYNNPLILERYLQLPGVTGGNPGVAIDDGPTICVSREGERYDYVFDDTGGNCAGRCTEHRAYHFASDASGQVTAVAAWESTSGAPTPTWFGDICGFRPRVEP
jgi:hypothetical protein